MQVNVLTAEGPILDYLVSTALGYVLEAPDGLARQLWMVQKSDGPQLLAFPIWPDDHTHRYSTDWARGGPIIDQKVTKVFRNIGGSWTAQIRHEKSHPLVNYPVLAGTTSSVGPTPLVAALRCVARSELGEWVEVPDCLVPPPGASSQPLDDDHPLACVNDQICGLLEGIGAGEDHEDVVAFFLSTGLPRGTVDRIHRAIASAEVQPTEAGGG